MKSDSFHSYVVISISHAVISSTHISIHKTRQVVLN